MVIRITLAQHKRRYIRPIGSPTARSGRDVVQQRMMDRWIEAAEARRVCERAIGEQIQVRPVRPTPQPLSLMTKLRTMLRLDAADRRPDFVPTARPAA